MLGKQSSLLLRYILGLKQKALNIVGFVFLRVQSSVAKL